MMTAQHVTASTGNSTGKPTVTGLELDATASPRPAELGDLVRVVVRPSASPMPLGFFTVAVASTMSASLQTHILPPTDVKAVGYVVLPAFVLQVIVAVFALMDRDTIAATIMGSFAASWLVDAMISINHPAGAAATQAVFFFAFSVFSLLMAVVAVPKFALFLIMVVAVPRFVLAGFAEATRWYWLSTLAGVFAFGLAAVSMYTAFALLVEDVHGKTMLPIGRSGAARVAIDGNLAAQLSGIAHSAGVRRSL